MEVRWDSYTYKHINTKLSVKLEQWDEARLEVNKKHPQFIDYNSYLKEFREEIEKLYTLKRIGSATKQKHNSYINGLLKYHQQKTGRDKISFTDLTKLYFEEAEIYFQDRYKPYTLNKSIQTIRKYINIALDEGILKEDPFKGYKYRAIRTKERNHLTEYEVTKIENIELDKLEGNLLHVRNRYLLSCYCGLRISDIHFILFVCFCTNKNKLKPVVPLVCSRNKKVG